MAGEGVPKVALTPESLPGVTFTSTREVEASVVLHTEDERIELEQALREKSLTEPERVHIRDIRITIPGFQGVARVREITRPHLDPEPDPEYEWAIKIFMPKGGLEVAKAPLEHQGSAESIDEAVEIIKRALLVLGHSFESLTTSESRHDRTVYTLEGGVKADVNVCTWKDGHEKTPPHVSAEFENSQPADATDTELKGAEAVIIETAASVGVPKAHLSSSRGLNSQGNPNGA